MTVAVNYFMPHEAFGFLMALVVAALVLNWVIISITHMKFKLSKIKQRRKTLFPSWGYPITNWVCLVFLCAILVVMFMTPGMRLSVYLLPVWMVVMTAAYQCKKRYSEKGEEPLTTAESSI